MSETVQLIIEIPKETYEYWQTHAHEYVLSEAIKNGTPLSAEGKYIKKEDLFERTINRNSVWNTITDSSGWGLEEIVNDLPTYSFPNREKGEWKMDDGTNAVCPICNKLNGARGDFCKWCGSDMRGKDNETDN